VNPAMRLIELDERAPPTLLPRSKLPDAAAELLWHRYSAQLDIEFPSPKTQGQWRLTPKGWVGFIPLGPELGLALRPKVQLASLFGMLEYAYRLRSLHFPPGVIHSQTLEEFHERLASLLARRILDRTRKGLHRSYLHRAERGGVSSPVEKSAWRRLP
jgi:5-methylcytosine-specific restriction enzyme subunit McrC